MSLLPDAIRASANESAISRAPDGTILLVQRFVGQEMPYNQEEYTLSLQRPGGPARQELAAISLVDLYERLTALDIAGFDPQQNIWQPGPAGGKPAVETLPPGTEVAQD